jgi:hypothetical protein
VRLHGQSRASARQAFCLGRWSTLVARLLSISWLNIGDVSFNLARVLAVANVLISGEDLCFKLGKSHSDTCWEGGVQKDLDVSVSDHLPTPPPPSDTTPNHELNNLWRQPTQANVRCDLTNPTCQRIESRSFNIHMPYPFRCHQVRPPLTILSQLQT